MRRSVWRISIATLCTAGLALGCASTPEEEESAGGQGQTEIGGGGAFGDAGGGAGGSGAGGPGGSGAGGPMGGAVVGAQDPETERLQSELGPIYFDYDRSTLRPDAASTLKSHAETIRGFPSWAYLTIEGNCDERGTEEYNLALGDRRAEAVKRYLVTLGIPEGKIRTVSYGELKPAVVGHDETAWKMNRRAEFQVSR